MLVSLVSRGKFINPKSASTFLEVHPQSNIPVDYFYKKSPVCVTMVVVSSTDSEAILLLVLREKVFGTCRSL